MANNHQDYLFPVTQHLRLQTIPYYYVNLNDEKNKFLYEGTFKIPADETELAEGILEIKVSNVKDKVGNISAIKKIGKKKSVG